MGVEELAAIRLERVDRLEGGQRQRGLPAVDDHMAALAVDRGNDSFDADGVGQPLREVEVGPSRLEERRADDHLLGAGAEDVLGPLDGADAAAHPARQRCRDLSHERQVVARAHGRVQIDHLHLGEARELLDPGKHVGVADGEPLALNELNDRAVLEIDGRNQHVSVRAAPECRARAGALSGHAHWFRRSERSTRRARRRRRPG